MLISGQPVRRNTGIRAEEQSENAERIRRRKKGRNIK
jgi:hypothetical protein